MQTKAEQCLIDQLVETLDKGGNDSTPRILNVGAGRELWIEMQLANAGCRYQCDRVDIDDCTADYPHVANCWMCSADAMTPVGDNDYDAAFANYVLEHLSKLDRTAKEIYRVLKPSGVFVASVPNPAAPEFRLAKLTPLWFHKMVRRAEAWETVYAFRNIAELIETFERNGFRTIEVQYYAAAESYLFRFPVLGLMGRAYDRVVSLLGFRVLLGNVCVVFQKPDGRTAIEK